MQASGLSRSIKIQGTINGEEIKVSGTDKTSGDAPLMGESSTVNNQNEVNTEKLHGSTLH